MPTNVKVDDLKINKLTKAQYEAAVQGGTIGEYELSVLTDDNTYATSEQLTQGLATKQDTISDLATIRSGAAAGATAVQPAAIADMETQTHASATYATKAELANKQDVIQYSTMPTAGANNVDDIVQFVGTTDSTYTNGYFYKCTESSGSYSWVQTDVQPSSGGSSLPDMTGQSGKYLTTDGTNASWGTVNALQNTATGSDALTILGEPTNRYNNVNIGKNSGFYGFGGYNAPSECIAIGNNAKVYGRYTESYNIAIGYLARTGDTTGTSSSEFGSGNIAIGGYSVAKGDYFAGGIAIGHQAEAMASRAIALGRVAKATAVGAIQINGAGYATANSTPGTLQIALGTNPNGAGWTNYRLLDSDGTIPEARLADTTNATAGQVLTLDSNLVATWATPSGGGASAPTLTWYTVSTAGNTLTIADTSSAQLVKVYKNGLLLQPTEDYSISGTTLTTVTAMVVGDKITTEVF